MTDDLRQFYEANGVDYDAYLRRLRGKDTLIRKYLEMFIADTTYTELATAVQNADYNDIGIKAHTLKGLALNINLPLLSQYSAELLSCIREGRNADVDTIFPKLKDEYERLLETLQV